MSRAGNAYVAARLARALLTDRLPGSRRGTVRHHRVRAAHIAETVWRRWHVGPYQWQLKHLRWYLQECTGGYASGTRYRHWPTVRLLIFSLEREGWIERLNGPWVRPTGVSGPLKAGRPVLEPAPPVRYGKQSSRTAQ